MSAGSVKILFLEDDGFTRNFVTAQLQAAGVEVEAIESKAALLTSNFEDYDLLLTDLQVNGDNMQDDILEIKEVSSIPIVLLSQTKLALTIADLHLQKPLDNNKIKRILQLIRDEDVDVRQIEAFAGGDEELKKSFISTFIQTYENELNHLNAEVQQSDNEIIKNRAHKMLSSVAYYNNKKINNLLHQLEASVGYMDQIERESIVDQVEAISRKLLQQLRRITQ